MMALNREAMTQWVKALDSGEYTQATEVLGKVDNEIMSFCCLGVACDLFKTRLNLTTQVVNNNIHYNGEFAVLPLEVMDFLGLELKNPIIDEQSGVDQLPAATVNDAGYSFKEIARMINEYYGLGVKFND